MAVALDIAIGKKVMGWRPHYLGPGVMAGWDTDKWRRMEWNPSTNIAHAWEVVERLSALGWRVSIDEQSSGCWCVWCIPRPMSVALLSSLPQERYFTVDEAAPLAICRAALKVLLPAGN